MKRVSAIVMAVALMVVAAPKATTPISAQSGAMPPTGYADRLYVINGGVGKSGDMGSWVNMMVPPGTPVDISAYAHLIKHGNDWMMFDTSTNDIISTMPSGYGGAANAIRWVKTPEQTIDAQFKQIGVTPDEIKYIGISHNHADHTGNIHKFKNSVILAQKREYEQAFSGGAAPAGPPNFLGAIFERNHAVKLLDGDFDVFGDGSVILFYLGGHTLGHQAALVRLKNTGYVLLSGDSVHFRSNFDLRRVPRVQGGTEENHWLERVPVAYERIAAILAYYKATLWVHHDIDDYKSRGKFAPQFFE